MANKIDNQLLPISATLSSDLLFLLPITSSQGDDSDGIDNRISQNEIRYL